ncbi:LuxR family transcriptional regulator [Nocardioides sp. dk4132]|uniref:LuxR family transcriptional regulator n=1 Tax=unclassified Nocardioides TaxID=2615069 RepID=UPI001296F7D0|nr:MULTISPECIES: LuxR family transcriptional regulator [unclassified Nocardioides]MQW78201.1 LuxR family transcriptional regulator [Nocardioides sp. dk4132]QGA06053.1 LuxR family transcriptional regulator [Nocardioides sp. dk884]
MTSFGPQQRALLEDAAAQLYDAALARGGIPVDDPRITPAGAHRAEFDLLVDLGLLRLDSLDEGDARWVPQDPAAGHARVVSPLSQEGARLLQESAEWSRTFAALSQTWRRAPSSPERGPFTYLHEGAIGVFLTELVSECEQEMLTAQPQAGRDPQALAAAALRDTAMLERGARMRTLYQHSARRSAVTRQYVDAVTQRGAEVRTLDEFFNRMIVCDRRVAVIPAGEDLSTAVVVREPSVVAYLVDIFERTWERGRTFGNSESTTLADIATEQRAMTIRMLIAGHPDAVSAKRLGVSPRTYAGYVADLKDEHDAQTRFQLGYRMGRQAAGACPECDNPGL